MEFKGNSGYGEQLTMQNPEWLFRVHVRLVAGLFFFFFLNNSSGNYGFWFLEL